MACAWVHGQIERVDAFATPCVTPQRPETPIATRAPATMRAAVRHRYGPPESVTVTDARTPTPGDDEVLVRVHAASLNFGDVFLLGGRPRLFRLAGFGLLRPKIRILGGDIAGVVAAVGTGVVGVTVGDGVIGDVNFCGWGGLAQYVTVPPSLLVRKPAAISFVEGAAMPIAGVTALQAVDAAHVQPGDRVLVNGASGGVGTFALQIARARGAEVTAVCSARNVAQAQALGAAAVVDYTRQDFRTAGARYDAIVDVATKRSIVPALACVRPGGRYVVVGGGLRCLAQANLWGRWLSWRHGVTVTGVTHRRSRDDLQRLRDLLASGDVVSAIDRTYALEHVREALAYVQTGRARAKVVVTVP